MGLIEIPVIGIGAGASTDRQVLVFHDLLGIRDGLGPRFIKLRLPREMNDGVGAFAEDVRAHRYPGPEHLLGATRPSRQLQELADATAVRPIGGRGTAAPRRPTSALQRLPGARRTRTRRPGCAPGAAAALARWPTPMWAASAIPRIASSRLTFSAGTSSVVMAAPGSARSASRSSARTGRSSPADDACAAAARR